MLLHPMPDISQVDFSNRQDIAGFVALLCQIGSRLGIARTDFKPTKETNQVQFLAKKVVAELNESMPKMSVADAFMVTSAYDFAYRLAYFASPDSNSLNKYILAAFDAMIHGDKAINEYEMYKAIAQGLRRRDRAYFDKPLSWLTTIEERWYKEAKRGFNTSALSDYDITNRLTILLRTDLTAYEGRNQSAFKQHLATHYRCYLSGDKPTESQIHMALG